MNENIQESAATGVTIRPDVSRYQTVRSASGSASKISGDEVSIMLVGATLDETYNFVSGVVGVSESDLRAKYGDKNPGQQRMFLGNLIRGGLNGKDAEKAAIIRGNIDQLKASFRESVDERMKAVEAEKAAKLQEKAEAKAAAEAEKAAAREAKAAERQAAIEAKAADKAEAKRVKDEQKAAKAAAAPAAKPKAPKIPTPKGPAQPQ